MNSETRLALASIKAKKQLKDRTKIPYRDVVQKINYEICNIQRYSLEIQEREKRSKGIIGLYYKLINQEKKESWESMFSKELESTERLNELLILMTYQSTENLKIIKKELFSKIDSIKTGLETINGLNSRIPKLHERYEDKSVEFEPDREFEPDFFEELKDHYKNEFELMDNVSEVALRSSKYKNDLKRLKYLKDHVDFYNGVINYTKNLVLRTNEMCNLLNDLRTMSQEINPMTNVIGQINEGLISLSHYSQELSDNYQKTFSIIENIEQDPNTRLLTTAPQNLNHLVARLMNKTENDLGENEKYLEY